MKKNYILLVLFFTISITLGQDNNFNNNGGDLLWSNSTNWSLNVIPNSSTTVRLPNLFESLVDSDFTVKRVQTTFATGASSTTENKITSIAGSAVLIIDTKEDITVSNQYYGIENLSNNNVMLSFNGNITIENSITEGLKNTLMRNGNGSGNSISFSENSLLTLNTPLEARSGSSNNFVFNGTLAGAAPLRVNANIISTFGSTSNNPDFEGDFVWVGPNAKVVVNTADNNVFLPAERKIQINGANGSIDVNGINVYQGNISVNGSQSFTFNANANQSNIGAITFAGGTANGTLNLIVDTSITELSFSNSSEVEWNSGTLNITGYKEGVLRFGTDNTGLTTAQLAQIVVDGVSDSVGLNSDGYLVNKTSLSADEFNESVKPIAYPTLTSSKIFFSKPQNNVKIINLKGQVLRDVLTENQEEISVDFLSTGLYLIVFDNKKAEKFIKK
ncbi:T9SS type A sorting domain-containing protein [Polaribacter sp.]|uniref:T9SS type A sorting domain-containing protein n=1 Tax=Polaribacter sp. TaxID=1920175 RepID=UPI003F6B875B